MLPNDDMVNFEYAMGLLDVIVRLVVVLNDMLTPVGSPDFVSVTVPLSVLRLVTVMIVLLEDPGATTTVDVASAMLKSG